MPKFIHTADWQIGKPYNRIEDFEKRSRLKSVRIESVQKIMDLVKEENCDFILVAGDLFDSPSPTLSDVRAVLSIIGEYEIPVYAIPGNHDFGGEGSFWTQDKFADSRSELAPNFHILLEPVPLVVNDSVILPCPLKKRHETKDLLAWLNEVNWNEYTGLTRIMVAHGSVSNFQSNQDYLPEEQVVYSNLLNLDRLPSEELDYIALGDWHGFKKINDKAFYSGTPEIDRFPLGDTNTPGYTLVVETERNKNPKVQEIFTSSVNWYTVTQKVEGAEDLKSLEQNINDLKSGVNKDLVLLNVSGFLSLEDFKVYNSLKEKLSADLIRLKLYENIALKPSEEEMRSLAENHEHPLISSVAQKIINDLEDEDSDDDLAVLSAALRELYLNSSNH